MKRVVHFQKFHLESLIKLRHANPEQPTRLFIISTKQLDQLALFALAAADPGSHARPPTAGGIDVEINIPPLFSPFPPRANPPNPREKRRVKKKKKLLYCIADRRPFHTLKILDWDYKSTT